MENAVLIFKPQDLTALNALCESNGIQVSEFNGKVASVDIEYESIMNFVEPVFTAEEKWLSDCKKVFAYWFENKEDFKIQQCVNVTGVTLHYVTKIYDKYLKL